MTERLTPERAVRLLRSIAAKREREVLAGVPPDAEPDWIDLFAADLAFVATLLADEIERRTS